MNRIRRLLPLVIAVAVASLSMQAATSAADAKPRVKSKPGGSTTPTAAVLLQDDFGSANGPNGLITNEYGYWNPWDALAVRSNNWWMGSGSFFSRNGVGTSGSPDSTAPDRYSERSTNSATFRLHTQRADFGSVRQEVSVKVNSWTTATQGYEGVVLWPKFVNGQSLYFAYILRKDGKLAMNKKCPGLVAGGDYYQGGSYFPLVNERYYEPTVPGRWYRLSTTVRDNPDGSVSLAMYRDGIKVMEAVDKGVGCAPLRGGARLGIRGDNTDFSLNNYVVKAH